MARPRSFDRDEVVHAAERQFRTTGYDGTTVDDLSTATGLGRGSLYAAFGDKHGVFLHALEGYPTRQDQAAGEALSGPDDEPHCRFPPESAGVGTRANPLPPNLAARGQRRALRWCLGQSSPG